MPYSNSNEVTELFRLHPLDICYCIHGWEQQNGGVVKVNSAENRNEKVSPLIKGLRDELIKENEQKLANQFVESYKKWWRLFKICKNSNEDCEEYFEEHISGAKISVTFRVDCVKVGTEFGCMSISFRRPISPPLA